jgi:hypothetical protein
MTLARKILVPSLLVLGGALASCAFLFVAERRIDRRLLNLLPPLDTSAAIADSQKLSVLHSRLVGIDGYLDQRSASEIAFGAPAMWEQVRRVELEIGLANLGSFFEQVDSLLSDPTCRAALDRDRTAGVEAPRLGLSRHRTNVLCAQALVDFDRPEGSSAAAKRLGQALDLIRLGDDGSLMGYLVSNVEEAIVLEAIQQILLCPHRDIDAIQQELEGRLSLMAREQRAESALLRDLAEFRARLRPGRNQGWGVSVCSLGDLMEEARLANCWEESLRIVRASGAESREHVDKFLEKNGCDHGRGLLDVAHLSHICRLRAELAQAALALAGPLRSRAGSATHPPQESSESFRIVESNDHVELCAESALAALQVKPGDPGAYLLCWTIPR